MPQYPFSTRRTLFFILCLVVFAVVTPIAVNTVAAQSSQVTVEPSDLPGSGTQADPYLIANVSELQAMDDNLTANYQLNSDIDASATKNWNNGAGFDPIGGSGGNFEGTLYGNGHTVSGLTISRASSSRIAFVEALASSAQISNVSFTTITITGKQHVSGVAGQNFDGVIRNVSVQGTINGETAVGGVVGYNNDVVGNVSVNGSINGTKQVGGVVGLADGPSMIEDATVSGHITGNSKVGGAIGELQESEGTVQNVSVNVSVSGEDMIGGLVGVTYGNITDSRINGSVAGTKFVGGVVGNNVGRLTNTTVRGKISGDDVWIGGLAGQISDSGTIYNSTSSGRVNGAKRTGGIVGVNKGVIRSAVAEGAVSGTSFVGGVAGVNLHPVGSTTNQILKNVSATGSVSGTDFVGGISGSNSKNTTIQFASVSARVQGSDEIGGIVGENRGTIQETFATGTITGATNVGGVAGKNSGTLTNSYWNTDTTDLDSSDGGTGLNTSEMIGSTARSSMVGFEFGRVWQTRPLDYPLHLGLPPSSTSTSDTPTITAPRNGTYVPDQPYVIDTTHNALGIIAPEDVGIKILNVTTNNSTIVATNISSRVPIQGQVLTMIKPGELSGDVQLETQLYNTSSGHIEATDRINLTAATGPGDINGNGLSAQDLDGDSLYEDVNGDGSVDLLDVQTLFANVNTLSDPSLNFNEDSGGNVDLLDVQALFNNI